MTELTDDTAKGKVDWTLPIETTMGEPRHVIKDKGDIVYIGPLPDDPRVQTGEGEGLWYSKATAQCIGFSPNWDWTPAIRNVVTTPDKPAIPAELVERMEDLVRVMWAYRNLRTYPWPSDTPPDVLAAYDEADRIVTALPKSVDPDLIEARKIVNTFGLGGYNATAVSSGAVDHVRIMKTVLAAIKLGRELERSAIPAHDRPSYFDGKRHD